MTDLRPPSPSLLALLGLLTGPAAHAQTVWSDLGGSGPVPRCCSSLAFDSARGVSVTFGGFDAMSPFRNDTWEWNGSAWSEVDTPTDPAPRDSHGLVYDSARGVVVMFGGGRDGVLFGQTWEYDGTDWTFRSDTGPAPRWTHGMAYDADRGVTVVFGGADGPNCRNDTWEWDGTSWTERTPAQSPPARCYPSMTYDAARGRVVMFGGQLATVGGTPAGDTWEYDGSTWTQRATPVAPRARFGAMLAWDGTRQRSVLFGGSVSAQTYLNGHWEWDGEQWTERFPSPRPPGRRTAGIAWDSARDVVLLFGGATNSGVAGDLWSHRAENVASYTPFGTGCAGSAGTPSIQAAPFERPWVGQTFFADIRNVPAGNATAALLGASNTLWQGIPLPVDLGVIGMPGCLLWTSDELVIPLPNPTGTPTLTLHMPPIGALVGLAFHNQVLVVDPGANPLGVVASNGATGIVGAP